jgi:type II secretory pathway component PulL
MRIRFHHRSAAENGSAVLVVFILLTVMLSFVMANSMALHHLERELRLLDQQHAKQHAATGWTNSAAMKIAP